MQILLIQGANMQFLGQREPEWYGTTTAAESDGMITRLGVRSYVLALDAVAGVISDRRAAG